MRNASNLGSTREQDTWSSFFPNARMCVSDVSLRVLADAPSALGDELEREAWDALILIAPLWPSPGCGRWTNGTFEPGA